MKAIETSNERILQKRKKNTENNRRYKARLKILSKNDRDVAKQIRKRKILADAKSRANIKNIEFNLSIDDFDIPEICPVLGIPINLYSDITHSIGSPTLDRIDSSKGYTPGNICVISYKANALKSDANLEEINKIISYMENHNIKEDSK